MKIVYGDMSMRDIENFLVVQGKRVVLRVSGEGGYTHMCVGISRLRVGCFGTDDYLITNCPIALSLLQPAITNDVGFSEFLGSVYVLDRGFKLISVREWAEEVETRLGELTKLGNLVVELFGGVFG